ncbi:MAG: dihydrofolate reductase family protein [Actinobacteria bacterium]|nr:dihydrofolate reductase family protein [Actinomycetota bacterium]
MTPEHSPKLKRLHPELGELDVGDAYGEFGFNDLATAQRPYVVVNMVATVDGQGRLGANTDRLGGEVDRQLFVQLREQVDCVLAGTRTIEAEQYKGPASRSKTRAAREARGLRPRPLFATVTRSGVVPWSAPVFQDEGIECVIFSDAELAAGETRATVTQVRETGPQAILRALAGDFDVRSVLLEGGPHLNTPFFAAGLVDELFLTVAPLLAGGSAAFPIVAGDLGAGLPLRLAGVLLDDEDHLYLRYRPDGTDGRRHT